MSEFVPRDSSTRVDDLASWNAFCSAYYDPIQRALALLRVPISERDDLAHSFLLKAAENNFLNAFRSHQEQKREGGQGLTAPFRTYLYSSLRNHVCDDFRRRSSRTRARNLEQETAVVVEAGPNTALDPDALYALDVLHQALQALRRHCEQTGKPHIWMFFEEILLADEFRGRRGRTRAELLEAVPGKNAQFLDNALTTAKRSFRRLVQEVIPRGLRDGSDPTERFGEWMAMLRKSRASQFNLLHLAYRVTPYFEAGMTQAPSAALVIDEESGGDVTYEEPTIEPDEDELKILLSFRLEMPLTEMLDTMQLHRHISPSSPFWPNPKRGPVGGAGRPMRPLCLLTLIDPSPDEATALAGNDVLGLLEQLKVMAKQLRNRSDHAMPKVFAHLIYTLVNVLAFAHHGTELHTIGSEKLMRNVRWFLKRPWLDSRVRPLFEEGASVLEAIPPMGPPRS